MKELMRVNKLEKVKSWERSINIELLSFRDNFYYSKNFEEYKDIHMRDRKPESGWDFFEEFMDDNCPAGKGHVIYMSKQEFNDYTKWLKDKEKK